MDRFPLKRKFPLIFYDRNQSVARSIVLRLEVAILVTCIWMMRPENNRLRSFLHNIDFVLFHFISTDPLLTNAVLCVSFAWNTRFPVRCATGRTKKERKTKCECVTCYVYWMREHSETMMHVCLCMLACARDSLRELVWLSIGLNRLRYMGTFIARHSNAHTKRQRYANTGNTGYDAKTKRRTECRAKEKLCSMRIEQKVT